MAPINLAYGAPVQIKEFGHMSCRQLGAPQGHGLGQASCHALIPCQPFNVLKAWATSGASQASGEHIQVDVMTQDGEITDTAPLAIMHCGAGVATAATHRRGQPIGLEPHVDAIVVDPEVSNSITRPKGRQGDKL